jgi:glycerol-3-phosphate dehydrogenase (NAD(P)+)
MPITEAMVALLQGRLRASEAVERLMGREAKAE